MLDSEYKPEDDDLLAEILSMEGPNVDDIGNFGDLRLESLDNTHIPELLSRIADPTREETSAVAIRQTRRSSQYLGKPPSFEDSQSSTFLDNGSFVGDEGKELLRTPSGVLPPAMPGSGRLSRPNSVPAYSTIPEGKSTHTVPARGGHWAWVPDPGSDGAPPWPPPQQPPGRPQSSVPVKTGRLPLATSLDQDDMGIFDRDVIDSFDILEMADTLIFENGAKKGGRHGNERRLTTNSCPMASLFDDDEPRDPTQNLRDTHLSSRVRSRPSTAAIPMSRTTSMKVNRCSRSQSSPHTSNLLAASCPPNHVGSFGTSQSLLDSKDSISDEKGSDPTDPDYEHSILTPSYSSRSLDTSTNGKKRHNPWTVSETVALINGVEELGLSRWAEIKRAAEYEDVFESRSAVDLKDKWRNLTRLAKLPVSKLEQKVAKDTSRMGESIPLESYLQIRRIVGIS
jgi:hypothetical protein